jgi:hypothetical protein
MASRFIFGNNVSSSIGAPVVPTDTSIQLSVGTGGTFPQPISGQQACATIVAAGNQTGTPNEIIYYTGVSGDTLTGCSRGQEGTAASTWSAGASIAALWTKGMAGSLAQQIDVQVQAGNYATDTGSANAGVITLTPPPANQAALTGVPVRVYKASGNNSGPYTLNANAFGPQPVTYLGTALVAGDLLNGQIYEVIWNGSAYQLISPVTVSSGGGGGPPSGPAGGDLTGNYPSPQIAPSAVTSTKIAPQAVQSTNIANEAVGSAQIAPNAVGSLQIADAAVGTSEVAPLAITTAKIALNAITNALLAQMPAQTIKSNLLGSPANPADNGLSAVASALQPYLTSFPPYAQFRNQQPSGGASGENLPGGSFTSRALNVVSVNNIAGASLNIGTGQITLPTGHYMVGATAGSQASASVVNNYHQLRISTSTGTTLLAGQTNAYAGGANDNVVLATMQGFIQLGAATVLTLDSYVQQTSSGGNGQNTGEVQVFADVLFTKVA